MSRKNFYATTAIGLCMVVMPVSSMAEEVGSEDLGLFAPLVQECIANPTEQACESVQAVITECAEDLEFAECAVLFEDAEAVFEDSARQDRVQEILVSTRDEIASLSMPAAEDEEDDDDVADAARADAERELLRGDEEPTTHSAPEILEGEPDEVTEALDQLEAEEAEDETGDEDEREQEAVAEPEAADDEAAAEDDNTIAEQAEDAEIAEQLDELAEDNADLAEEEDRAETEGTEPDVAAEEDSELAERLEALVDEEADLPNEHDRPEEDAAEFEDIAEEREAEVTNEDAEAERELAERLEELAEDDADLPEERDRPEDDAAETEESTEEERELAERREALTEDDAELPEEGDRPEEEAADSDESPDERDEEREEVREDEARDERALEEERERLRAEAEELAEEAPEYVVEDAPEEEFLAPAEEAPELDSEQQSALDRLLENPEIAAAVTLLGGALAQSPEEEEPEQRRDRVAAALAGLQRDRDDEVDGEVEAAETEAAEIIEEQYSAEEIRTSRDDFASRLIMNFDAEAAEPRARERRDLERAGLAALGALAVGMIIDRNRVVARSDERVVVDRGAGDLAIWRDDDVILRQEGATRRIERYDDGSTLTRWQRADGSQVVTIRDATGRVLWRERILADGTAIELVNDMREIEPVDRAMLPPPRTRELRISQRTDPELALAMLEEAEADARALERGFTLRQIRETRELRELVPMLSPDPITFETNRANVRGDEAPKLMQVGRLMERLIDRDPREVFLVEGHTDATGPAAFNLGLSDRRAESVALALTEFFDVPPENLVIQGYGERHLRIPTLAAEERNRRVAIRRITPLLAQ
jgi:outer membrane protein OmpA-like peptidoglycan-associated protein